MEGKCGGEKTSNGTEITQFNAARWTILSQAARFNDIECLTLSKAGGRVCGGVAAWSR